jgi:hypothetical protein
MNWQSASFVQMSDVQMSDVQMSDVQMSDVQMSESGGFTGQRAKLPWPM